MDNEALSRRAVKAANEASLSPDRSVTKVHRSLFPLLDLMVMMLEVQFFLSPREVNPGNKHSGWMDWIYTALTEEDTVKSKPSSFSFFYFYFY